MSLETYIAFLLASSLLWITPGQDTIYIIARSISQGRLAGIVSALGISTGALGHAVLASTGVSLIILTSPILFLTIKVLGGVYLIYLGVLTLFSKSQIASDKITNDLKLSKIYMQGVLTNILNPKVALFFIAFLPQFLNTSTNSKSILFLGLSFVIGGTIWCLIVAWFASSFSLKLKQSSSVQAWFNKISAFVYIALGLKVLQTKI